MKDNLSKILVNQSKLFLKSHAGALFLVGEQIDNMHSLVSTKKAEKKIFEENYKI